MGREGLSIAQMAARLGVAKASLWDWAQAHAEFSVALAHARTAAQSWWEDAGRTGVFAEKFNAQVWKFIVANRFKDEYAERRIQEVSGPDGGPIQTETKTLDVSRLSREERDALKRTLLVALGER
jgi:transcriptional regulator with XRE-family HTH domain